MTTTLVRPPRAMAAHVLRHAQETWCGVQVGPAWVPAQDDLHPLCKRCDTLVHPTHCYPNVGVHVSSCSGVGHCASG